MRDSAFMWVDITANVFILLVFALVGVECEARSRASVRGDWVRDCTRERTFDECVKDANKIWEQCP